MNKMTVHLITIARDAWESQPSSLTFAQAAESCLGIERRIAKGVNVQQERLRLMDYCRYLENAARSASHSTIQTVFADIHATIFVAMVADLEKLRMSTPEFGLGDINLARGFTPPGENVACIAAYLNSNDVGAILFPEMDQSNELRMQMTDVQSAWLKVYAAARTNHAGVVIVLELL